MLSSMQVQYTFIFDALNEYLICGETELDASSIRETVSKLSKVVSNEDKFTITGFEQQYMVSQRVYIHEIGRLILLIIYSSSF